MTCYKNNLLLRFKQSKFALSIKSLASQTLWYGLSNILGRFLNYFLTIILFWIYKPEYSIIELAADISLDPSSKTLRFDISPGGNDPGPDGDGICLPVDDEDGPMPGDGARLGGVARPKPESVSKHRCNKNKMEKR